eukprot:CAMPEP_0117595682 /NCGR_PEP_ID=MMETSP0784-20121206/73893_1 /TAXON_ID=39447 /ORGANISM="" /LENGTH=115 /DNA_ID=CAMNT_0005397881 /DNA_START=84 /DNA_END=431 /DNA_ORIENTATION=-
MFQEMMLKDNYWTAKFIRDQRAEKEERERKEKTAMDTIMRFVKSDSTVALRRSSSEAGSASRSRPPTSLSIAGAMSMDRGSTRDDYGFTSFDRGSMRDDFGESIRGATASTRRSR